MQTVETRQGLKIASLEKLPGGKGSNKAAFAKLAAAQRVRLRNHLHGLAGMEEL